MFSLPFGWILWTTGVVSFMTLPVRSQDESVTKLDRGARVRRGRPRHLAPRALRRLATVLLGYRRTTNFGGDGRNFPKGLPAWLQWVRAYSSSVASRRRARGAREPRTEKTPVIPPNTMLWNASTTTYCWSTFSYYYSAAPELVTKNKWKTLR